MSMSRRRRADVARKERTNERTGLVHDGWKGKRLVRREEGDSRIRLVDPEMPESKGERATERERERERVQRKKKSCATPLAGDQTPRRTVHGVTDEERLSNAPPTLPAREKHLSTFEKGCGEAISRHRGPLTF